MSVNILQAKGVLNDEPLSLQTPLGMCMQQEPTDFVPGTPPPPNLVVGSSGAHSLAFWDGPALISCMDLAFCLPAAWHCLRPQFLLKELGPAQCYLALHSPAAVQRGGESGTRIVLGRRSQGLESIRG